MGLSHYCRLSWLNDRQLWHWHKNISISVRRSGTARILDCGFARWPGLSVVRPKAEVKFLLLLLKSFCPLPSTTAAENSSRPYYTHSIAVLMSHH